MASDKKTLKPVRLIRLLNMAMVVNIILLSNDIQLNPGSGLTNHREMRGLRIFHLNICSLRNKVDELRLFCFLSINETWLDESFSDEEVWLPGFSLLRKDRDCHGGESVVYIAEHLSTRTQKVKYNLRRVIQFNYRLQGPQRIYTGPSFVCGIHQRSPAESARVINRHVRWRYGYLLFWLHRRNHQTGFTKRSKQCRKMVSKQQARTQSE